ncbi:MAG: AAA family ATPase, partial [Anaerolineae bacterium]
MDISHIPLTVSTSLGELLRFLRRRARLSQRELSIAVGYSESHISRIENNERPVDRASLLALFVPAVEIENEPETIARLLALCEQAQPLPASSSPAPVPSRPGAEPQPVPPNRLPVQLTSFIGRVEELAELRELLAEGQTRLLTLTGAGGCGKTRLALRVGEGMAHAYSHGVWLVELAALTDPRLLVREVASTFDLQENAERPLLAALTDFLRPRQALLILDNCEHLVDAAAHLAAALLQVCPDLRILATSRENLAVPGEIVYPVQPLALPPAL